MTEPVLLIALVLAALAMFCVAGLGIVAWLLPQTMPTRLMFAPIVGAAALTAFGASAVTTITSASFAWFVVLPLLGASAAAAIAAQRFGRLTRADLPSARWLGAGIVPPFVLGLTPFLANRTGGPINMATADAWFWYVPMARLLQHTPINQPLVADQTNPTNSIQSILPGGMRVGHDAAHGAFATLVGAPLDRTVTPFVLAVLLLLPITVLAIARAAQQPWWVAALAAVVATSSPAIGGFLESSGPGLFGLAAVPALLWVTFVAVGSRSWPETVVGAVLLAGVLGTYPEALPAVVAGLAGIAFVVFLRRPDGSSHRLGNGRDALGRIATLGILAVALTPAAFNRTLAYLQTVRGVTQGSDAGNWGVTAGNVWQWSTGMVHLFEIRRLAQFTTANRAIFLGAALVFLAVVVLGAVRGFDIGRAFLLVGLGSTAAFAAFVDRSSDCSYCFFRSAIFVAPFLALGFASGVAVVVRRYRLGSPLGIVGVLAATAAVLFVVRADVSLVNAARTTNTVTRSDDRRVSELLTDPRGPVLVEGAESASSFAGFFWVPAALNLVAESGARPTYDGSVSKWIAANGFPGDPFRPDYRLVVTRYGGVRSPRTLVGQAGRFSVFERQGLDAQIVTRGAWSVPNDVRGADALPWLSGPFDIVVSGTAGSATSLVIGLTGPRASDIVITAEAGGAPVPVKRRAGTVAPAVCLDLPPGAPNPTRLELTPGKLRDGRPRLYVQPDQPEPPLKKAVAISSIAFGTGCT